VIEPLLEVFDYGTPAFNRLRAGLRRAIIEEAAASGTDLVITFVWGLQLESDAREVADYLAPYVDRGADIAFVELYADLPTRLERNRTEHRLAEKRSKRDVAWSDGNVQEMETHTMSTVPGGSTPGERMLNGHRHLRLDNTALPADAAAEQILGWLDGHFPA
jgi:hypothetical protein